MKKYRAVLLIAFIVFLYSADLTFAVQLLRFEREFSGKGATRGAFSPTIHVAFDARENIYVSDTDNRLIQKLSPTGDFVMQIPDDPTDVENILKEPGDITVDSDGNIYVADTTAHHIAETSDPKLYMFAPCVHKFNSKGEWVHTYFVDVVDVRPKQVLTASLIIDEQGKTAFGILPRQYDRKLLIGVDGQKQLFVLDAKKGRIHKFDADGERLIVFGEYGAGDGSFDHDASDIAVDGAGNVWIADTGNHRVVKFDAQGEFQFSVGHKGRGHGEFTRPVAVVALVTGEILVKDASAFKRHLGGLPVGGVVTLVSPPGIGVADTIVDDVQPRSTLLGENPIQNSDLDTLNNRLRLLEEAEYRRYVSEYYDGDEDDAENKAEEDEDLKAALIRATIYHKVIERVQKFDSRGNYTARVIYEIDKQSEAHNDLGFLTLDPFGHVYLRDGSELTIQQYSIDGFSIRAGHMDGYYNTRAVNVDNDFTEDYEDIDPNPDVQDELNQLRLSHSFLWGYSLSERWNVMFADELIYGEQDERYQTPPKPENSYDFQTKALTNTFAANVKFITDPNPYRYKELNVYFERIDGTTDLDRNALFQDLNRERQEGEGDASSTAVGLNWDIFAKANLWLEYSDLNPAQTSRNFTRRFFDVSGDLYEVFASRNQAKQFIGEFTLKF